MKKILEVCCGSYEDAIASKHANRIELNSALHMGGLTCSLATFIKSREALDISIICMVRPRGGGFYYQPSEIEVMMLDAKLFMEHKANGIAFGFLNEDATINKEATRKMVDLIHHYDGEAVFHRAFDCVKDPHLAIQELIDCNVDRILSSGLKNKAIQGQELLKELQSKYGDQIEILAGSGVNETNAISLMDYTGIHQVHSSCKDWEVDPTTSNQYVSYDYQSNYKNGYEIVCEDKVKQLMNVLLSNRV